MTGPLTDRMRLGNDALSRQAKAGVVPVPPLPPRRKKEKREHAIYVYGARHPEQPTCWLAQFDESDNECSGAIEHAHLFRQQTLRKLGLGRYLGDAAVWEWACRHHHFRFDNYRGLFVPRCALSEETERFSAANGLGDYLDKHFGEREMAA